MMQWSGRSWVLVALLGIACGRSKHQEPPREVLATAAVSAASSSAASSSAASSSAASSSAASSSAASSTVRGSQAPPLGSLAKVTPTPPRSEPGTLRFVVVRRHTLLKSEERALGQMRAELERPTWALAKVVQEPAGDDEQRFVTSYVAAIEQPGATLPPLPESWLGFETVVVLPIPEPIPMGSQRRKAGYQDLMIFHPPSREAAYSAHYRPSKSAGPSLGVDLARWVGKYLKLREGEARR